MDKVGRQEIQTDRQADKRHRQTERQRDRETERQRDRHRYCCAVCERMPTGIDKGGLIGGLIAAAAGRKRKPEMEEWGNTSSKRAWRQGQGGYGRCAIGMYVRVIQHILVGIKDRREKRQQEQPES